VKEGIMATTAIGLFKTLSVADEVVRQLKAAGLSEDEVRVLAEPRFMPVTGVLSTPELHFSKALRRDIKAMGATEPEADALVGGVLQGGVLVFATGTAEQLDIAAGIMNRSDAAEVEELTGAESNLPAAPQKNVSFAHSESTLTGRVRGFGGGVRIFVW
jgi:hypothetical protein